ncbi:MAG: hypothetical protein ABSH48_26885 [Verrucomicrobiota bacterium]
MSDRPMFRPEAQADAAHERNDIRNSSVYQQWDDMDQRSKSFSNYELGYLLELQWQFQLVVLLVQHACKAPMPAGRAKRYGVRASSRAWATPISILAAKATNSSYPPNTVPPPSAIISRSNFQMRARLWPFR